MAKPSWCSATGTTYFAPASRNRSAHSSASNRSARNIGMKSLYPKRSCGPYVRTWCSNSAVPRTYMWRGYHSLPKAGTLYTPQWMKIPNLASRYHSGTT